MHHARVLGGCVFFFQAEDGIRDYKVTGVQTCALPIFLYKLVQQLQGPSNPTAEQVRSFREDALTLIVNYVRAHRADTLGTVVFANLLEIGRASCRERV